MKSYRKRLIYRECMLKDSDIGNDLNSDGQKNLYLNSKIDLFIGNEKVSTQFSQTICLYSK